MSSPIIIIFLYMNEYKGPKVDLWCMYESNKKKQGTDIQMDDLLIRCILIKWMAECESEI